MSKKKRRNHGVNQPTSGKRLTAADRSRRAIELRQDGLTYAEISKVLGCSPAGAYQAVRRVLEQWKSDYVEVYEELRYARHHQLENLIAGNFEAACRGDAAAGSIVLKAMNEQAKLHGLYAEKAPAPEPSPYDGISEQERMRLLIQIFENAGVEAIEALYEAVQRARARRAAGKPPPIEGNTH